MYEKWLYAIGWLQYYGIVFDLFLFMWSYSFAEKKVFFANWKKSKKRSIKLIAEVWRYCYKMDANEFFHTIPTAVSTCYSVILKDLWDFVPEELR